MASLEFKYHCLLVLITLVICHRYERVEGICKFEGCDCFKDSIRNEMRIECIIYNETQTPVHGYFPRQTNDPNFNESTHITYFIIYGYDFEVIPDFALENLSISRLYLFVNKMNRIGKNSFAKLRSIKFLKIQDESFVKFESGSLASLYTVLDSLTMSSNNIDNTLLVDHMQELTNLNSLTELDLKNNSLTSLRADQFAGLVSIKKLDLDKNRIDTIDKTAFADNTKLETVSLNNNELTDLNQVLVALEKSSNLENLYLQNNRIDSMKSSVLLDQLTLLDLSINRIKSFDSMSITGLNNIERLILSSNQLEHIDDEHLNKFPYMYDLVLNNNKLNQTPSILDTKLLSLNMINQNGRLVSLIDYAFEKRKSVSNTIVKLNDNHIVSYGDKTFCSRYTTRSLIRILQMSYASMKSFERCFIKQLASPYFSVELQVDAQDGVTSYEDVCNCDFLLYAQHFNVTVTGVCAGYMKSCAPSSNNFVDSCLDQEKFVCSPSSTSASTTSTTRSTSTISASTSTKTLNRASFYLTVLFIFFICF